jgi:hypothetical protein
VPGTKWEGKRRRRSLSKTHPPLVSSWLQVCLVKHFKRLLTFAFEFRVNIFFCVEFWSFEGVHDHNNNELKNEPLYISGEREENRACGCSWHEPAAGSVNFCSRTEQLIPPARTHRVGPGVVTSDAQVVGAHTTRFPLRPRSQNHRRPPKAKPETAATTTHAREPRATRARTAEHRGARAATMAPAAGGSSAIATLLTAGVLVSQLAAAAMDPA